MEDRTLLTQTGFVGSVSSPFNDFVATSGVGPRTIGVDHGDFYMANETVVRLLRSTNELAIGLHPGADPEVFDRLAETGGLLSGFEQTRLDAGIRVFTRGLDSNAGPFDQSALLAHPEIAWVTPTFSDAQNGGSLIVANEVLVSLEPGVNPNSLLSQGFSGFRSLRGTADQFIFTLSFGAGFDTLRAALQTDSLAGVNWASPDAYVSGQAAFTPNDPEYANQWHLHNTSQFSALADADVDAPEAWDTTTGGSSITIAVLDDGVEIAHPDLAANIFVNADEIASNGIDDDENGYIDDVNGWDFANNDNDPNPTNTNDKHGTPVAGVAAAKGNNSLGVTGASQNSKILPVKFYNPNANGSFSVTLSSVAEAFYYASGRTANGLDTWKAADILNNSWSLNSPSTVVTTAIDWSATQAREGKGAVNLAATGNAATNYKHYSLSGFSTGNWVIEFRYTKNASISTGSDTAWLSRVILPNSSIERFDTAGPSLPSNWTTSGSADWTIVDDPSRSYGTGRYVAKAGAITHDQSTILRSPSIAVSGAGTLNYSVWVSSETTNDTFAVYVSNNGGSSFSGPFNTWSGNTTVTSLASYPANIANVIGVGASTDWDYRSDYSQYGAEVEIVAPSGGGFRSLTTTDRTGSNGYNTTNNATGDYTTFSGTSGATPLAAGVAALVLSKNPFLTFSEVRQILRNTADKIGGNNGATAYDVNGFNQYYGYGKVNANAALAATPNPPSASINNVSVNENAGTASFTVSLSTTSAHDVTIDYATNNGTATAPGDYTASSGTVTILAGQTSANVTINIVNDSVDENDETFTVTLSNPTNAYLGTSEGIGTIVNDDVTLLLTINDVSVSENAGTATFTINLSAASASAVSVNWATANGTAVASSDYTAGSGTVVFAAGETSKTMTVSILNDLLDEDDETYQVLLSNAVNATISDDTGQGTVLDNDATPTLRISDASVAEGHSGTKTLNFTVTLSAASGRTVIVGYSTFGSTATAGSDYVSTSGVLTFSAGQTTRTFSVTLNGDTIVEEDETFVVNLSSPSNATISDFQGIGKILNDDVTIAINDVTQTEGHSGATDFTFTVSLSQASSFPITVRYLTANGTATTASGDYVSIPTTTLTFDPGETSKTVIVQVTGDSTIEADETFSVSLNTPTNAIIADASGSGKILNDDVSISISNATYNENDVAGGLSFTLSLSAVSTSPITVQYSTSNGSAIAPGDYTTISGTVTIPAGSFFTTIPVPVINDALDENDETFVIQLLNPTNAIINNGLGTATILDDDVSPTVSISDVTVEENAGTATFAINLSAVSGRDVSFDWSTSNGTALEPGDYTSASGAILIPAGSNSATVTVNIVDDSVTEGQETFLVNLTNPQNTSFDDASATATILSNDAVAATLSINDVSVNEGTATTTFTVTLSSPLSQAVTVSWATSNDTAIASSDFTANNGTLTFDPGQTSKTVTVSIINDALDENDETFLVLLSNPANASLADDTGQATIIDNDATPSLRITDASVTEGHLGIKTLNFSVILSKASGRSVSVAFSTASVSATAGSDFVANSGVLIFSPGQTTKTVSITLNGDTAVEADETFIVNLTSPSNATISDFQGVGKILNDDVTIAINDVTQTEGHSGATDFTFTISLSQASSFPITVKYLTTNGAATAAAGDFVAIPSTILTFNPGETSKIVTVSVNGDTAIEADETFSVSLNTPTNATIADTSGAGKILNDDVSISISDVTANESAGTFNFTVSLSAASTSSVTVKYTTANGTAISTSDYTAKGLTTLTFPAGTTSLNVSITIKNDSIVEPDEDFFVNLSASTNAIIADAQAVGTILNDDTSPLLLDGSASTRASARSTSTLSINALTPIINAAKQIWLDQGISSDHLDMLNQIQWRIENLPGLELGRAFGNAIVIDINGADQGWYVDPTPLNSSEFVSGRNRIAPNRVDLLTVVTHEIGHLLGFEHHEDGVMSESLQTGVRNLELDENKTPSTSPPHRQTDLVAAGSANLFKRRIAPPVALHQNASVVETASQRSFRRRSVLTR